MKNLLIVLLILPALAWSSQVAAQTEKKMRPIQVTEESEYGELKITSNVAGATFTLFGTTLTTRGPGRAMVIKNVPTGLLELVATKPGYQDWSARLRIRPDLRTTVRIRMVKGVSMATTTTTTLPPPPPPTTLRSAAKRNLPKSVTGSPQTKSLADEIKYYVSQGAEYRESGYRNVTTKAGWTDLPGQFISRVRQDGSLLQFFTKGRRLPIFSEAYPDMAQECWIAHSFMTPDEEKLVFAWSTAKCPTIAFGEQVNDNMNYYVPDSQIYIDVVGDGIPRIKFPSASGIVRRTGSKTYIFGLELPQWVKKRAR